jgi:hypothetical protein
VISPEIALIAATGVHLGFQATVTAIVYPALARTAEEQWPAAHQAHTRAITPVVAVVYGSLLVAGGWALWSAPSASTWVAVAAIAAAFLITAIAAAPAHGRLAGGHDAVLIRRLRRADRVRAAAAAVAFAAALAASW